MKTLALAVLAALSLAACAQPDGSTAVGAVGSPAWMMTASASAKAATYQQACTGYGFQPGTPEMARCAQMEAHSARDSAARGMAAAASSLQQQQSVRLETTCTGFGRMMTCM